MRNLDTLVLREMGLSGPIPPWLGTLANLERLNLSQNALTGTIPAELGNLAKLRGLWLHENPLVGQVPGGFTNLALETFWIHETGLCVPADAAFQAWVATIEDFRGDTCGPSANRPPEPVGVLAPLRVGVDEGGGDGGRVGRIPGPGRGPVDLRGDFLGPGSGDGVGGR